MGEELEAISSLNERLRAEETASATLEALRQRRECLLHAYHEALEHVASCTRREAVRFWLALDEAGHH